MGMWLASAGFSKRARGVAPLLLAARGGHTAVCQLLVSPTVDSTPRSTGKARSPAQLTSTPRPMPWPCWAARGGRGAQPARPAGVHGCAHRRLRWTHRHSPLAAAGWAMPTR
jgi:hypothetical protein